MRQTECKIEGCDRIGHLRQSCNKYDVFIFGYCAYHYRRYRRFGDPIYVKPIKNKPICKASNCLLQSKFLGYCTKHYEKFKKYGDPLFALKIQDGKKNHPLFATYNGMKARCYIKTNTKYKNYGARGIKMCKRWLGLYGFWNFVEDMGEKPTPQHSLDRINNNKGYNKSNCRWATAHQQSENRRNVEIGYVGVQYLERDNKWRAVLTVNKITYRSPHVKTKEEALKCRKKLENKYLPK
jgi:hypothetical protein